MPIYEYRCRKCTHPFEELMFPDDPTPPCPKCKARDPERLMSVVKVVCGPESIGGIHPREFQKRMAEFQADQGTEVSAHNVTPELAQAAAMTELVRNG